MFKDDFNWQKLKEDKGDLYDELYIPETEEEYLLQLAKNRDALDQYTQNLSFPVKSEEIIKINSIQQNGIFNFPGICGLRDFKLNDDPASNKIQNSPPERILGELKLLDKQVEIMWNKSESFSDKFKTITFQAARLLTLQAFDDANKRAIKEVLTSSFSNLMNEYNISQNWELNNRGPKWECISSKHAREAIHSNNIADMAKSIADIFDIDHNALELADVEIPPYQVMAKMGHADYIRNVDSPTYSIVSEHKELNLKEELLDAKLHDGLFENNPDAKLQWVRPSDLKDRMNSKQIEELKNENKGFLKKILNKQNKLPESLKSLIEPSTRDEFLRKLMDSEVKLNLKKNMAFKALTVEPGKHGDARIAAMQIDRFKSVEEIKNVKLQEATNIKPSPANDLVQTKAIDKTSIDKTEIIGTVQMPDNTSTKPTLEELKGGTTHSTKKPGRKI